MSLYETSLTARFSTMTEHCRQSVGTSSHQRGVHSHTGLPGSYQPVSEHYRSQGQSTVLPPARQLLQALVVAALRRERGGDTGGTICMNVCLIGNRVSHRLFGAGKAPSRNGCGCGCRCRGSCGLPCRLVKAGACAGTGPTHRAGPMVGALRSWAGAGGAHP